MTKVSNEPRRMLGTKAKRCNGGGIMFVFKTSKL